MLVYPHDRIGLGRFARDLLTIHLASVRRIICFVIVTAIAHGCAHKVAPKAPSHITTAPVMLSDAERACLAAPNVAPGRIEDIACLAGPNSEVFALWAASHRCLRHIYLEDNWDDAVVGALLDKLKATSPMADATADLRETLQKAQVRAHALFETGPVIRALEVAFFEARFDHARRAWQGIDGDACRRAHETWNALAPTFRAAHQSLVVSVDPLGYQTLESLLSLCAIPR